jgi:hypothetical protein
LRNFGHINIGGLPETRALCASQPLESTVSGVSLDCYLCSSRLAQDLIRLQQEAYLESPAKFHDNSFDPLENLFSGLPSKKVSVWEEKKAEDSYKLLE